MNREERYNKFKSYIDEHQDEKFVRKLLYDEIQRVSVVTPEDYDKLIDEYNKEYKK